MAKMASKKREMCAYEMLRQSNMADNKAMLAKLMEELKEFDDRQPSLAKPAKPKTPRPKSERKSESSVSQRNPSRSSRSNPVRSPPVTRMRSRRSSISSATSDSSVDPQKSAPLVVKFGLFSKKQKVDENSNDIDDWEEEDDEPRRRKSIVRRDTRTADQINDEDIDLVPNVK